MGSRVLRRVGIAGALVVGLAAASTAQAAFPGANGRIAINSFAPGIETINADGTGATLLTHDGGGAEWSADGTKIAFNRCAPTCHIWVMSSNGTGQVQVTTGAGEYTPSWSPDGTRLVFVRSRLDQIWTVEVDGTGETLVASGLQDLYDAPQWSPDGTKIVFASDHRQRWPQQEIYTVHPDGTGMTRLTTASDQLFPCEAYPQDTFGPDWSPDGTKIAYDYFHDTADGECTGPTALHVMNADGTSDHVVVGYYDLPDYIEGPPAWAPDGTKIALDASAVAYVVNVNDGTATVLTGDGPPSDWQPIPGPKRSDYKNSNQFCKAEQAFLGSEFASRYGGRANAYGKCVSQSD
jgi:WD40-like Beta Propeller Repeat